MSFSVFATAISISYESRVVGLIIPAASATTISTVCPAAAVTPLISRESASAETNVGAAAPPLLTSTVMLAAVEMAAMPPKSCPAPPSSWESQVMVMFSVGPMRWLQ